MATYKVIQDVEAEDKLIGPLTLRQFIYAGITALSLYLSYIVIAKGATFLIAVFLPVGLLSGFFAFPWKLNQPTEVWALAKIRFLIKPRQRVWDQSSIKELVVITAPKIITTDYTKGLTQTEIQSRLKTLAKTIDSRGWAIKDVDLQPKLITGLRNNSTDNDRLINIDSIPSTNPITDNTGTEEMLDEANSQLAKKFDQIILKSAVERKQNIINKMSSAQNTADPTPKIQTLHSSVITPGKNGETEKWFINGSQPLTRQMPPVQTAIDTTRTINNYSPPAPSISPVNDKAYADILNLARNNDLNIATLARRVSQDPSSSNEVIIKLH